MTYDIPTRPLGATGITVSVVGLGCNRIGESIQSDDEWIRLLHQAADWGITVFDTATQYAGGRSQELIGKAFGNREDVVIATKVTPIRDENGTRFTYDSIVEGAENCLRILRRDCIDVLQTHGSGSIEEVSNPAFAEAMERLKEQGKIRARASATFNAQGALYAIEHGLVDALQITYNLVDRDHALPVLPLAGERGIGLLARMPYQRGSLTGKFRPGQAVADGYRAKLQGEKLADDIAAAERFRPLGEKRGSMGELAMQYVLAEERLSATIPGARSIEQVRQNIENALAPPLSDAELAEIERIARALGENR
ncbi:MAG: aldo/keto reductase [Spirochaetaceae bacterium]|nr:MAG: aldo/keto reductase [Spirochaetaceae bacterium]